MRIAIVGAGVIGVSTAYYLQKQGHDISVFDSLPGAGLETSYANAGLLTPSLCDPWNAPGITWNVLKHLGRKNSPIHIKASVVPSLLSWGLKFSRYSTLDYYYKNFEHNMRLANYSLQLLNEMTTEINLEFQYKKTGTLKIFRSQQSSSHIRAAIEIAKRLDIPAQHLNTEETIAKEPALFSIKHELGGSVYYTNDASGDAFLFTKNMAHFLKNNQVQFFYHSKIKLITDQKNRCLLETNLEKMEFDCIVLAAGYYSPQLIRDFGISLPMQPLKGYSITVDCKHWEIKPDIPIIDQELHAAITPLGAYIRVTGFAELAGFDKTLRKNRIENLKTLLARIYPSSGGHLNENTISSWTGLRPTSVDGVPFITSTKYKNLYLNTGHGHIGWTTALGSGKILADQISGEPPQLDIHAYSLRRF